MEEPPSGACAIYNSRVNFRESHPGAAERLAEGVRQFLPAYPLIRARASCGKHTGTERTPCSNPISILGEPVPPKNSGTRWYFHKIHATAGVLSIADLETRNLPELSQRPVCTSNICCVNPRLLQLSSLLAPIAGCLPMTSLSEDGVSEEWPCLVLQNIVSRGAAPFDGPSESSVSWLLGYGS